MQWSKLLTWEAKIGILQINGEKDYEIHFWIIVREPKIDEQEIKLKNFTD